jgi:hypothetical protein
VCKNLMVLLLSLKLGLTRLSSVCSIMSLRLRCIFIYLFICSLFNNACSSSDYIASNERMIVNYELEMTLKEAAVASFNVLSLHLPGGTEENHEKPQDSRSPGRYLNPGPPEYKAGVLTTRRLRCKSYLSSLFYPI